MKAQKKTPNRFQQRPRPSNDPILARILKPVDISLVKYHPRIQRNYPKLLKKDLHLAEVYRVAAKGTSVSLPERTLDPVKTKVDTKGRVWVDVLIERKKRVKIRELRKIMQVHGTPGRSRFISGRVQVDKLPRLRQKAVRLETARPVKSALNNSLKTISANHAKLDAQGFGDLKGSGVIVGIVDTGCDFNHPNFKKNDQTRLLYLWDQNGKKENGKQHPENYQYGVEYGREQINRTIAPDIADPYGELGYEPESGAHGTHILDIAAGNSQNPEFRGVAPDADLIFVELGIPTTEKKIAAEEMKTWGSSKYLYDAVSYIFEKADKEGKPAVINISLAANGGAHDGTSFLELHFDELLQKPGRAIVIAAGNEFCTNSHKAGQVTSDQPTQISWFIPKANDPNWRFRQEMELWYTGDQSLKVEVFEPSQDTEGNTTMELLGSCQLGEIMSEDSSTVPSWLISNHKAEKKIGKDKNYIHILVDNRSDDFVGGERQLMLSVDNSDPDEVVSVNFHAWIERNLGTSQSVFADLIDSDRAYTVNGIGNAALPLVVGSFSSSDDPDTYFPTYLSSAGPSLNLQCANKPELSAPGENITCAQARESATLEITGTSAAAPHVTGVIALMFQKALHLSPMLKMQEIRDILIATAHPNSYIAANGYHPQLGFGRVDALDALKEIDNIEFYRRR